MSIRLPLVRRTSTRSHKTYGVAQGEHNLMKFLCFGYLNAEDWATKSESEQQALVDECLAYDETLKREGHWAGGEALRGTATTLRLDGGKVSVTDGPYAETKELLGGLLILEATDLEQAVRLISKHPGLNVGTWEIRPGEDISAMIRESEQRRSLRKQ